MVKKNYIFFSDLTVKENTEETIKYFKEVYLTNGDDGKVIDVDGEFVMTKHYMTVELADRNACKEFKVKYEKLSFNGKLPRVSVFLG